MNKLFYFKQIAIVLLFFSCSNIKEQSDEKNNTKPNGISLKDIAHEAFIYAYPIIEQVKTVNGM